MAKGSKKKSAPNGGRSDVSTHKGKGKRLHPKAGKKGPKRRSNAAVKTVDAREAEKEAKKKSKKGKQGKKGKASTESTSKAKRKGKGKEGKKGKQDSEREDAAASTFSSIAGGANNNSSSSSAAGSCPSSTTDSSSSIATDSSSAPVVSTSASTATTSDEARLNRRDKRRRSGTRSGGRGHSGGSSSPFERSSSCEDSSSGTADAPALGFDLSDAIIVGGMMDVTFSAGVEGVDSGVREDVRVDTGASMTAIPVRIQEKLGLKPWRTVNVRVGTDHVQRRDVCIVTITFQGKSYEVEASVRNGHKLGNTAILGRNFLAQDNFLVHIMPS